MLSPMVASRLGLKRPVSETQARRPARSLQPLIHFISVQSRLELHKTQRLRGFAAYYFFTEIGFPRLVLMSNPSIGTIAQISFNRDQALGPILSNREDPRPIPGGK